MTALAARSTTTPAGSCPHLNTQCVEQGPHDEHWGPDNEVAAIRPDEAIQSLASARLYSYAGTDFAAPRLSVGISGFDGDLTLAEVDQLAAGLRDFANRLQIQAAHLAAAQRLHEVNR
ncbi:hypothetical protein OG455_41450 [Kitasatospora sp. NBC_01287]|uniref:DUF6907 domain-containing protein n=1 Tax=Kitasatospora sp. NBC_01287 TaxID=2903573 RepID=UPI0022580307|nr:hypothetical protein [Kitasatospora sp. NBC_01287]MCX4750950.1 hypothetical protein [Kitasatospora sp. NBC_01287]MCX4751799.1 hypothetical protein [Kitasatospora sp. NBC_01287]MCX4751909.1 hypothetical protein [Kitasatospora sp. NBC_01287]